jgi:phage terminase large subunit-like protein
MGEPGSWGTGMIPSDRFGRIHPKAGIPNAVEMVEVKHVSGGTSIVTFKSYDQNVQAFYGTARDVIWLDEECPELIYSECLIRTMTTNGIVYVTFTPLHGLTPFIVNFSKNADFLEGAQPIIAGLGEEDDVHSFRR